jgi:diguanylate cyclase (GGDEF)-like protein
MAADICQPPFVRTVRVTDFTKYVRVPRLESIRSKILVFAVMATLLPCSITLAISYVQNRAALEAKIAQELLAQSTQTSREMAVWLKERLYDLRVFASSYEVSGNLDRVTPQAVSSATRGRLYEYLGSLHERFTDFDQLLVLDLQGRVIASSVPATSPVRLPHDWLRTLRVEGQLVGDAYWDAAVGKGKLIVAVPVQRLDGRVIGAFAAELNLRPVQRVLRTFVSDTSRGIYLLSAEGSVVASSREVSSQIMKATLRQPTMQRLVQREGAALPYLNITGTRVLGSLKRVPEVPWVVLAETPAEVAFREVNRFRNLAALVMVSLLLVAAGGAYRFGVIIVRPLDRLIEGARQVAAGQLDVDLPVAGGDEVGYLTRVFNGMVWRLREGRKELDATNEQLRLQNEELEKLSLTDGLTGLANRRFLVQHLNEEAVRFHRTKKEFSVLMADVDHFKQYNDTFGHPAGDEVLKKVARILQANVREIDCVARYGGEEFCVMLPETEVEGAVILAERICEHVAATEFDGRKITLSIGVASLPDNGDTPDAVVAAADEALYQAKREGRNRVVQAPSRRSRERTSVRERNAKRKKLTSGE